MSLRSLETTYTLNDAQKLKNKKRQLNFLKLLLPKCCFNAEKYGSRLPTHYTCRNVGMIFDNKISSLMETPR